MAQVAFSVQASDWSGSRCRGKEGPSGQEIRALIIRASLSNKSTVNPASYHFLFPRCQQTRPGKWGPRRGAPKRPRCTGWARQSLHSVPYWLSLINCLYLNLVWLPVLQFPINSARLCLVPWFFNNLCIATVPYKLYRVSLQDSTPEMERN